MGRRSVPVHRRPGAQRQNSRAKATWPARISSPGILEPYRGGDVSHAARARGSFVVRRSRGAAAVERSSGLSRYEIWKRTGVDQATLSRFVNGERLLSLDAVDKLAEALGLEIVAHGPRRS
ncbi:MAG: helix-turn-helix transcriptional regulator [Planctomycetia bacterium]|nr:helix-turn-helix transcriptional regulator [Planctomycetia bacterium]